MEQHPKYHFNYCPRCSAKVEFNSEKFSFKCNKCEFHYFLNSAAAVTALIFNDKNELLFTLRGVEPFYGKLDLPGGFIDPGENAETALMREIKEELDLVPSKIEYFGSFPNEYFFTGTIVFTTDIVFKCYVNDFSQLKCRDDIVGLKFIDPAQVKLNDLPFISVKNIVKKINHEYNNKK